MLTPASDKGSKRKQPCHNSDKIHSQSHERILRSTKLLGAQIVEHDGVVTRSSPRLNFKVINFYASAFFIMQIAIKYYAY